MNECVISVPIEAHPYISLRIPLAVNHHLQYYHGPHTHKHTHYAPFFFHPTRCTHGWTPRCGSVQQSRQSIDKLINSILPASCEEVLTYSVLQTSQGDAVSVCFWGILGVLYVFATVLSFRLELCLTALITHTVVFEIYCSFKFSTIIFRTKKT